jgi:hypothetical protein
MNHVMNRIIDAPPALRRFLDARALGASHEELKKLSALAMTEQAERSGKPFLKIVARDGENTNSPPEGSCI